MYVCMYVCMHVCIDASLYSKFCQIGQTISIPTYGQGVGVGLQVCESILRRDFLMIGAQLYNCAVINCNKLAVSLDRNPICQRNQICLDTHNNRSMILQNRCMYVCMYVCMYCAISRTLSSRASDDE